MEKRSFDYGQWHIANGLTVIDLLFVHSGLVVLYVK
jgi:hypothetical protein